MMLQSVGELVPFCQPARRGPSRVWTGTQESKRVGEFGGQEPSAERQMLSEGAVATSLRIASSLEARRGDVVF